MKKTKKWSFMWAKMLINSTKILEWNKIVWIEIQLWYLPRNIKNIKNDYVPNKGETTKLAVPQQNYITETPITSR